MATDWKELLGSLKESGGVPLDETPDSAPVEGKKVQTTPLRVVTDRKGRKGKTATIVEGFETDDAEVEAVARKLKTRLGTGGSARGGEILIQGDRAEDVRAALADMGFNVSRKS